MTILAAIAAFLNAATAALRAFPLWLAWRQSEQLEALTDEIIVLEARARPDERPRLDRLRVKIANARKQHEALLAVIAASESRDKGRDDPRDVHPPG
jgi:hypothetical protein